jgi:hypothetical protein
MTKEVKKQLRHVKSNIIDLEEEEDLSSFASDVSQYSSERDELSVNAKGFVSPQSWNLEETLNGPFHSEPKRFGSGNILSY